MHTQVLNAAAITRVAAATASGTTAVTSSVIDTQGFESVVFFGTVATGAADITVDVQQGAQSNLSDAANLAGSRVVASQNGHFFKIEISKPRKRYLRLNITRTTATALGELYAARGGARSEPANPADVTGVTTKILVSPAEGTP